MKLNTIWLAKPVTSWAPELKTLPTPTTVPMFKRRGRRAGLAGPVEELVDRDRAEGDARDAQARRRHRWDRGRGGQSGEELRREREPLERHVQRRHVDLFEIELIEPAVDQGEGECLFEGKPVGFAV